MKNRIPKAKTDSNERLTRFDANLPHGLRHSSREEIRFPVGKRIRKRGRECSHLAQKIGRTHSRKVSRDSTIFSRDGRSIQTIRINWNYSSYSIRQRGRSLP